MNMALIAIASDKGAPGVTTAALALAAVWPRPVLLAECDPAGGDLVYRFPAAGGGHLDPRRGVLSLAVVARRGMQPRQVWEHVQKLHGGLDVLAGVTNAEQGAGLSLLWGPIGKALASLPQADVIADCGRLGADGPVYDLLAEATTVVLVTKVHVADVIRLRDRAAAFAAAAQSRGRRNFGVGVVVVADHKKVRASLGEVQHVLGQAHAPATVLGGIAHDSKGADLLSGEWGGSLDRTMLIKTARQVARQLVHGLPPIGNAAGAAAPPAQAPPGGRRSTGPQPAAPHFTGPQPAAAPFTGLQASAPFASPQSAGSWFTGPQPAFPAASAPGPAAPGGQSPAGTGPQQVPAASTPGQPGDLAAMPLAAPTISSGPSTISSGPPAVSPGPAVAASAPRTTFSCVLGGRSGRHQAGPAQADNNGSAQTQAQTLAQSHAAAAGNGRTGHHAANHVAHHAGDRAADPIADQAGAYSSTQAAAGPGQPRAARHAQPPARHDGTRQDGTRQDSARQDGARQDAGRSVFIRAPMAPLTPSATEAATEAAGGQENPEDAGWGVAPWERPGPSRSGGG
jgi:MinD-like ATPase involved in chromosome partitioning or flagellar assembly